MAEPLSYSMTSSARASSVGAHRARRLRGLQVDHSSYLVGAERAVPGVGATKCDPRMYHATHWVDLVDPVGRDRHFAWNRNG